jgi:hypothetical protein
MDSTYVSMTAGRRNQGSGTGYRWPLTANSDPRTVPCRAAGLVIRVSVSVVLTLIAGLLAVQPLAAQMPDPRQMAGMSMPSPDLPDGTVTVRVIRGQMTNNLAGVRVELTGAGETRTATTGADGRAQFTGVPAGARVLAVATVDGERLESKPIEVPVKGGIRALLVASESSQAAPPSAGAPPDGPASPGTTLTPSSAGPALSLGPNSRIATEFADDVLQVFYLLEIVNRTSGAITPPAAFIFDMPSGAQGTTVLEGSTPQANAKASRVTVTGPFPPGATSLQIAFRIDTFGSTVTLEQRFPLPLDAVQVAVQKIGDMKVSSPQIERTQDAPLDGSTFTMGAGPRLAAGAPVRLELSGLPHHSRMPVYIALALAGLMILVAAWAAFAPGHASAATVRRRELMARREQGLAALAALEKQHQTGAVDESRYASRRATLLAQLERVYGELDAEGGPAGGQGVAA